MPLKVLNINQAVRGQFLANPSGYGTRPCSIRESTIGFFSATDGTRLYYQGWGSGEPVVLTHTWLRHSGMWEYQFHALVETGLRCAGHDRCGHGRSDAPGGGYDYDALAVLLETLDLRDVRLVGHSMGGGEIVRYLSRRGRERVARIALIAAPLPALCATPDNPGPIDPLTSQVFVNEIRSDRPRFYAAWGQASFAPHLGNRVSAEAIGAMLEQAHLTSPAWLLTAHTVQGAGATITTTLP